MDYVEEHRWVGTILVEKAALLSCDPVLLEVILDQFRARHVRVIAADTGFEPTSNDSDASRARIRETLRVVGKFQECIPFLRLKAARNRVREQKGHCEGRKPFGCDAHEQEILKRILSLHRKARGEKRLGYYRIATILNREGHRTRSGRPWIGPTIRGIIQRQERRPGKRRAQRKS